MFKSTFDVSTKPRRKHNVSSEYESKEENSKTFFPI